MHPWLYEIKVKQVEYIAATSRGMMTKWKDKKPISFVTTFHSDTMVTVSKRGKEIYKPRGTKEYNLNMVGIHLEDKKLSSYESEGKRNTN
jgi:hypothetical protein